MGLGPFPVWRSARSMQGVPLQAACKARASWNKVGLFLLREMEVGLTRVEVCRWSAVCCFLLAYCFGRHEDQFSIGLQSAPEPSRTPGPSKTLCDP